MPQPKISALLNNCSLYALTPEIKKEVLKFSEDANYDNHYKQGYLRLKNTFANFYQLDPNNFSWKKFADILEFYNSFDNQIILGPVLRCFMLTNLSKDKEEFLNSLATQEGVTLEEYTHKLKNISSITGRYQSLSPDELFAYVSQDLGLSLIYYKEGASSRLLECDNSIHTIQIYHQGDLDNGHWERTPHPEERIDYKNQHDAKLSTLLPILEQSLELKLQGFNLLRKHIQLRVNPSTEDNRQFTELNISTQQIELYLLSSCILSKELAIQFIGILTTDSNEFIKNHPVLETNRNERIERYLLAPNEENRLLLNKNELEVVKILMNLKNKIEQLKADTRGLNKHSSDNNPAVLGTAEHQNLAKQELPQDSNQTKQPLQQEFLSKLSLLQEKSSLLKKAGFVTASSAAENLYNGLKSEGDKYFALQATAKAYQNFKEQCNQHIKKHRPELEKHRGWAKIIANIVAFILSMGIGYLIAAAINAGFNKGKCRFFSTDSAQKIDDIEEYIHKSAPAA